MCDIGEFNYRIVIYSFKKTENPIKYTYVCNVNVINKAHLSQ